MSQQKWVIAIIVFLLVMVFIYPLGRRTYYEFNPPKDISTSNAGLKLHQEGKYREALDMYAESLSHNPTNGVTYANRGDTYMELGMSDSAFNDYAKALELGIDTAAMRVNRGNIYLNRSQFDLALVEYGKSISIRPVAEAYVGQGLAQTYLWDDVSANQSFDKAISLGFDSDRIYVTRDQIRQIR
jgi:tetratricopeptide (TPR) repeat protein